MGKIAITMSLMKASWQILKKDKELLLLPVISGVCCLSIMTIFVVLGLEHGWLKSFAKDATAQQKNMAYWFMFFFYYCNYLVIIFFNSAIIACAVIRMNGGNPTLEDGLQAAVSRFPQIAGWALIASTIGFLLGMVESGSQRGRGFIARILDLGRAGNWQLQFRIDLFPFLSSRPAVFVSAQQNMGCYIFSAESPFCDYVSDHTQCFPICAPEHFQCSDICLCP
jgi:hypothetical protein